MLKRNLKIGSFLSGFCVMVYYNFYICCIEHCGREEGWIAYHVEGGVDQTTPDINLNTSLDTYIALVFIDNTEENKN